METRESTDFDVFLTYSHRDRELVTSLDVSLRLAGLHVFLDERDVLPGDRIVERVFEGITSAHAQIVVLSSESIKSGWVRDELAAGRSLSMSTSFRVVPVLVDDVIPPPELLHIKYLSLKGWRSDALLREGIAHLLHAIGAAPAPARNATLNWTLIWLSELRDVEIELTKAEAFLEGGDAESLGLVEGSRWARKYLINESPLGESLTAVHHRWFIPSDDRRDYVVLDEKGRKTDPVGAAYPSFLGGLALFRLFILDSTDVFKGTEEWNTGGISVLVGAITQCLDYLSQFGISPSWSITSGSDCVEMHDFRLLIRPIRVAVSALIGDALRVGVVPPLSIT